MSINLKVPDIRELKPRLTVFGVGGAGGNAVNNMITAGLQGVDFVVANTDAQALTMSKAERIIQMGVQVTEGLGAGSQPDVGRAAAEEVIDEIRDHLTGAHMVFVTAGMGGGTGTGAAPVIARVAKELGILTVGVVTKPFHFEGQRRMKYAEAGIAELQKCVDTQIIIPNQNLFRVANEKTTFADAFAMADQVLYSGVACITDLMVKEGLINLDFADVALDHARDGQGDDGHRRGLRREARAALGRGRDRQPADRRRVDEGRPRSADLDHRRQGPHAVRGRRGRHPHPRGGRSGGQHHRRRDLRRKPRRHHPRFGGGDRHRLCRDARAVCRPKPASPSSPSKLRVDTQRIAAEPQPQPQARQAPPPPRPSFEQAATAAVAAALASPEDVTIRPITPKPSLFVEPVMAEPSPQDMPTGLHPAATRACARSPRMPRIDELPVPAQNQIRAQRGEVEEAGPEKQRMTLLQRLAQVGLGRRDDSEAQEQRTEAERPQLPPLPQRQPVRMPDPVSEYAKRPPAPAPQGLDIHGRQALPVHKPVDDDQLEIPAFLRRQAN